VPGPAKVKVVALIVAGFIARLKVAETIVLGHTPTAPLAGNVEITAGATHGLAPVAKVHTKLLASAMPNMSVAPVVMVAVYAVLSARGFNGVKVKIVLVVSWVIVPVTPGATVKVVALMVEGFIALLKVAVITALGHTPAAPLAGATEITVGGLRVGLVPALSGSLHPAAKMIRRNAVNQIL